MRDVVRNYYGRVLRSNQDLKTSACCVAEAPSARIREVMKDIDPEVLSKSYGCGSPIPEAIEGQTVLDLGSGSGRDCFILSKLVGPTGRVIGIDMTPEQVAVARRRLDGRWSNLEFLEGHIEDLQALGIGSSSIDVVVSNCVINLSLNKERVFSEIFRVLKPGGELCFSDVFAGRRVPGKLAQDPVLLGECLGGALYVEDFRRLLARFGVHDFRFLSASTIDPADPEIQRRIGSIDFHALTVRAFKLELEDGQEDYGQVAIYLGSIADCPREFALDPGHVFPAGQSVAVSGNTAAMLTRTRLARHFRVEGDGLGHFGPFRQAAGIAGEKARSAAKSPL